MTLFPLFYAPRLRAVGFVEMAKAIGHFHPQLLPGEEGRRGPESSGAVATDHYSNRAIQKSRIPHLQVTGPSWRTLIAAKEGSIVPFLGAHLRASGFVEIA